MDYQTVILTAPQDLPAPPGPDQLSISGLSVISYCAHRVNPVAVSRAIDEGLLTEFTDDRSYVEKLRPGSGFFYSKPITAGPLPDAVRRQVPCRHAPDMRQSVVWLGDEYVLSAIPIVLSRDAGDDNAVEMTGAISIDQVINLLALLAGPGSARDMAARAARSLTEHGIAASEEIERTWPLPGNFGIQIWNLDGTSGRDTNDLYRGTEESIKYAWEIAAILSYNSEHLLEHGLWLRRSPQQVFSQVRSGFGFFEDHMVFVNADCCLEMSHLPAWLRRNSQFRLSSYGYDSSSIYLWTAGMLQRAIVEDLAGRYRGLVADLGERSGLTATEHSGITQAQLKHLGLVDRITSFRGYLTEARSRSFDESQSLERSLDSAIVLLRREIEKVGRLADGLLRIREEQTQSRRDAALATIGIILGVSQIPSFVAQVQSWIDGSAWTPLVVSGLLILISLMLVPFFWRRKSNQ